VTNIESSIAVRPLGYFRAIKNQDAANLLLEQTREKLSTSLAESSLHNSSKLSSFLKELTDMMEFEEVAG
jgi:hypothetical protein